MGKRTAEKVMREVESLEAIRRRIDYLRIVLANKEEAHEPLSLAETFMAHDDTKALLMVMDGVIANLKALSQAEIERGQEYYQKQKTANPAAPKAEKWL